MAWLSWRSRVELPCGVLIQGAHPGVGDALPADGSLPCRVICPPALRPTGVVLLAMLAAEGTSALRNVYVIDRGYELLAERLNLLGAEIDISRDV